MYVCCLRRHVHLYICMCIYAFLLSVCVVYIQVFALFREWPTRPPACVSVEVFLGNSGQESVAERLASEGSYVALLSEGKSPVAAVEGDLPPVTGEVTEYSPGTWKGDWEGNSPLAATEEGERTAADAIPPPPEDVSDLFGRSTTLHPTHTNVLSEQASSVSNVGKVSSAEGKAKKGVFGRFVSALQATPPLTFDPSSIQT